MQAPVTSRLVLLSGNCRLVDRAKSIILLKRRHGLQDTPLRKTGGADYAPLFRRSQCFALSCPNRYGALCLPIGLLGHNSWVRGSWLRGVPRFFMEGRRLQRRDRLEQIDRFHTKIRELIFLPWMHYSEKGLASKKGSLYIGDVLVASTGAEQRYFSSGLEHLQAYGLDAERESIIKRINAHNSRVEEFAKVGGFTPTVTLELQKEQAAVLKSVQSLIQSLQKVIYDMEDNTLKGKCEYEKNMND
jgi:hypothetical protein